jgi:hypothetical protein
MGHGSIAVDPASYKLKVEALVGYELNGCLAFRRRTAREPPKSLF